MSLQISLMHVCRDTFRYGLGWQHGYQKTGAVQSTLTTKLKGAWGYNGSYGDYRQNCDSQVGNITFDVADYVIPPQVNCTDMWFNLALE